MTHLKKPRKTQINHSQTRKCSKPTDAEQREQNRCNDQLRRARFNHKLDELTQRNTELRHALEQSGIESHSLDPFPVIVVNLEPIIGKPSRKIVNARSAKVSREKKKGLLQALQAQNALFERMLTTHESSINMSPESDCHNGLLDDGDFITDVIGLDAMENEQPSSPVSPHADPLVSDDHSNDLDLFIAPDENTHSDVLRTIDFYANFFKSNPEETIDNSFHNEYGMIDEETVQALLFDSAIT